MAVQMLGIKTKFTDDQGRPLIGGSVHTYYAGTSLPQDTFSDPELTVPNTNPVKLDDTGSANIFLKGTYRVRVFDRKGKFVEEQDNVDQLATVVEVLKNKGGLNTANERIDSLISEVNSVKEKTLVVESIADLSTINNPKDGLRVYVKSYYAGLGKGGGHFTYDSLRVSENDGGSVINGWVRDEFSGSVEAFGSASDGVTDNYQAIQSAVDYLHSIGGGVVNIPQGHFYVSQGITIKEGVSIIGAGSGVTILDQKEGNFNLISTPLVTPTLLSPSLPMPEGSTSYSVSNSAKAGDFFRIGCTDYWSLRWAETPIEDGGVIRKWYEAEMLEVESATSSVVKFKNPSFVNVSTSGLAAEFFTPSKSMGVKGMTLQKSEGVISGVAVGLSVSQASNFYIDDVETKFYDYAGIDVSKSANVYIQKTNHIGGDPSIGLCYGIVFNDGCRDVQAINVTGQKCRHVVAAGGGSGYAIPAYVSVSKLKASNSYNASFDAHGNSAYFNYSDMIVDKMGYAEGVGHTVSDIIAIADKDIGASFIVNGINLTYNNIYVKNHDKFISVNGVRDSYFKNIKIESDQFTNIAFRIGSSWGNTFDSLDISCPKASNATSLAVADSCFSGTAVNGIASIAVKDTKFINTKITGFPVVVSLGADYCEFQGLYLKNCGWKGSVNTTFGMIQITNAKSPVLNNVIVDNTNTALDFSGRFFMKIEPSKGSASKPKVLDKITLTNIVATAKEGSGLEFVGKILTDDFVELAVLNNVYVDAISTNYTVFKPESSILIAQNIMPDDTYSKVV